MAVQKKRSLPSAPVNISGVFPHLAVKAGHKPQRTETGIGALMPWADRLWFVTYVAHKSHSGSGTGLFFIDDHLKMTRHPKSVVGTYANRMIHKASDQCIIGPHIIDIKGKVRTFESLVNTRLTATCEHLSDPENMVYFVGMEGEFCEANVHTLKVKTLFDLKKELKTSAECRPHFKDGYTAHGRVVIANNSYYGPDFDRGRSDGRLAEWDGATWRVLEETQFNTVAGRNAGDLGSAIFAVGQDRASALLKVFLPATGWRTYRLPKSTHTQDHAWTTEWPRIREVESERWLMDASGLIYELPSMTYANSVWGVRPVCSHLRIIGDYCSWNGLLVMAGDQTTPINDSNTYVGQPQANLWFGKTDDLWGWGKPQGWGGPWFRTPIRAGQPSDPFLMTGFEQKCLHVRHTAGKPVRFEIELDITGVGDWAFYEAIVVDEDGHGGCAVFADGLSAHWVRLTASDDCEATAQFFYT